MTGVRPAVAADASRIADAHISAWQRAYRGVFPDDFLDRLDRRARTERWSELIEGGGHVLVAEKKGRVVGFSSFGPARQDDETWGEVYSIYVHPRHWNGGHGRRLIVGAESQLATLGYERALLWVLDSNRRARGFYESQGWVPSPLTMTDTIADVEVTEVRYERSPLREG